MFLLKDYIKNLINNAFESKNIVIWYDNERFFEKFFNEFHMDGVTNIYYSNSITQLKSTIEKNDPYIKRKYLIYVTSDNFDSDYEYFGKSIIVNLFDILKLTFGIKYNKELIDFVDEYKSYIVTNFDKLKECYNGIPLYINDFKELVLEAIFEINHFSMDDIVIKLMFASNKAKLFELIQKPTLLKYFYRRLHDNYGIKIQQKDIGSFTDKISFIMLINAFYYQSNGRGMNLYESFIISDNVKRERIFKFVDDVWRNNDKYKQEYIEYCKKYEDDFIDNSIPTAVNDGVVLDEAQCDIFIGIDEKLYNEVKRRINDVIYSENDIKLLNDIYKIIRIRENTFWSKNKLFTKWTSISYLIDFLNVSFDFNINYKNKIYLKIEDLIKDYISHLYKIDFNYRKFREFLIEMDIEGDIISKINQIYNLYLDDVNYKYSILVEKLSEFKINGMVNQQIVWNDFINQKGRKCIVFADALNYELGKELESNLVEFNINLTAMLSSLPSVTEVGMTRLIMRPDERMILKSENSGVSIITNEYNKNLIQRENRKEKMMNDIQNLQFKEIVNLLMQSADDVPDNIVVFSRDIDSIGESGISFGIEIFKNNIRDIVRVAKLLLHKGYTVFITSDHGYLYTVNNKTIKAPQGDYLKLSSRYGIGSGIQSEHIIKDSEWCNIESDFDIVFARGITEYSIKGGNAEFDHGGISLQENIIPYIKIAPVIEKIQYNVKYNFSIPQKIKSKVIKIFIDCDKEEADLDIIILLEGTGYNDQKNFSVQIKNGHAELKYRLNDKLPSNNEYITIKIFNEETQLKMYEGKLYVDLLDDKKLF